MRIWLTPVGSRGDVQPMLTLAMALQARGHDVLLCCPPNFADWIAAHDIPYHPLGRDIQQWLGASVADGISPLAVMRMLTRFLAEEMPRQIRELRALLEHAAPPDLIITATMGQGAVTIAEHLKIPSVYAFFSPAMIPSDEYGPLLFPITDAGVYGNRALWRLMDAQLERFVVRPTNPERLALNLPPWRTAHDAQAPHGLCLWDEALAPLPADLDRTRARTGYPVRLSPPLGHMRYPHPDAALDPDLTAFLDAGPPPLYVGFGSMPDPDPAHTMRVVAQASAAHNLRVVYCTGWSGAADQPLPPTWHLIPGAPHDLLFPRCAAAVHHGGAGTTAAAARAGIPQLIVPFGVDQFDWAARLYRLGLAPKAIPRPRRTPRRLRLALHTTLDDMTRARAQVTAERLGEGAGVEEAVRWVEDLPNPPPYGDPLPQETWGKGTFPA